MVNLYGDGRRPGYDGGMPPVVLFFLASVGNLLLANLVILSARFGEASAPVERNAVSFVAVGTVVGALTGLTDLAIRLGSPLPPLGHVGSVICTVMLAVAASSALYKLLFVGLYERAERRRRLALIGAKEIEGLEGKGEAREYLNLLVVEVDRLNEVVESLLAFARPLEPRRVFQPFYTTKSEGTGFGLSIARRIAEAHGGKIVVSNLRPRGCKFTFLLPMSAL